MRILTPRVAGLAILAVLVAVLLGGCELREGGQSEYGESISGAGLGAVRIGHQEFFN